MAGPPGTRSERGVRGSPPGSPRTCSTRSGRRSATGRSSISGAGPATWRSVRSLEAPREPRASTWALGRSRRRERWPESAASTIARRSPSETRRRCGSIHTTSCSSTASCAATRTSTRYWTTPCLPRDPYTPSRLRPPQGSPGSSPEPRRAWRTPGSGSATGSSVASGCTCTTWRRLTAGSVRPGSFPSSRSPSAGLASRDLRATGLIVTSSNSCQPQGLPGAVDGWKRGTQQRQEEPRCDFERAWGSSRLCTIAGSRPGCLIRLGLSVARAVVAAPALVTQLPSTPTSTTSTPVAPVTVAEATAPCPSDPGSVGGPLPKLTVDLRSGVTAYAKNVSGASVEAWMDSGGRSGGGVPASAVRTLIRRGLGAGLTDEQVHAFLQPGFLRGISDPWGGARLLDFISQQDDPAFLGQLAAYAGALDGREMSWMSAQAAVFDAFPVLRAAYMSQAAAIPPDLGTAEQMLSLANQGYRPAETTIQAFLAAGNHPSAGAQNAGGVPDGMLSTVYDSFVANYAGPLSPPRRRRSPTVARTWRGSSGSPRGPAPARCRKEGRPRRCSRHRSRPRRLATSPTGEAQRRAARRLAPDSRHGTGPLTPGRFRGGLGLVRTRRLARASKPNGSDGTRRRQDAPEARATATRPTERCSELCMKRSRPLLGAGSVRYG